MHNCSINFDLFPMFLSIQFCSVGWSVHASSNVISMCILLTYNDDFIDKLLRKIGDKI